MITVAQLAAACDISPGVAEAWHEPLIAGMTLGKCETEANQAAFLATCGHESAGFTRLEESFNYSPRGLMATWSSRFDAQIAQKLGRTSEKPANRRGIANHAYGSRGGNRGEGYKFRGRGPIQLTHRDNYQACGDDIGIDLIANPDLVATPEVGALAAGWFWMINGLYKRTGFLGISRVVNLGRSNTRAMPHGWDDRQERYSRAMDVLSKPNTDTPAQRAQRLLNQ